MLVCGGIQGDEPGGFMAASLLATRYEIKNKLLWIVPNLNFPSIIKRSRGISGDMNRKFAYVSPKDVDYKRVKSIQKLIIDKRVKLIVNLHDGSGFYRYDYIDKWHNPKRWGQSSIIDQEYLKGAKFGNLHEISKRVVSHINRHLLSKEAKYHIKNTKTKDGDYEMQKSLTYFAIKHKKAAFGNEASKSYPTHIRVYYHLLALEEFMRIFGIEFKRDFRLTPKEVKRAMNSNLWIKLNDKNLIVLDNVRKKIRYVPMNRDINYIRTSSPVMALIKEKNKYRLHYGNRKLTLIYPEYIRYDKSLKSVKIVVDKKEKRVNIGSIVGVKKSFMVKKMKGIRVNVIGYVNKKYKNESGIKIEKRQILKKYSLDKSGRIYRRAISSGQEAINRLAKISSLLVRLFILGLAKILFIIVLE